MSAHVFGTCFFLGGGGRAISTHGSQTKASGNRYRASPPYLLLSVPTGYMHFSAGTRRAYICIWVLGCFSLAPPLDSGGIKLMHVPGRSADLCLQHMHVYDWFNKS